MYLIAGVQRRQQHRGTSWWTVDVFESGFQSAGSEESETKRSQNMNNLRCEPFRNWSLKFLTHTHIHTHSHGDLCGPVWLCGDLPSAALSGFSRCFSFNPTYSFWNTSSAFTSENLLTCFWGNGWNQDGTSSTSLLTRPHQSTSLDWRKYGITIKTPQLLESTSINIQRTDHWWAVTLLTYLILWHYKQIQTSQV